MENTNTPEVKKVNKIKEYYHRVVKYRLYGIVAFILGALSMRYGFEAVILVAAAMFVVPAIIANQKD